MTDAHEGMIMKKAVIGFLLLLGFAVAALADDAVVATVNGAQIRNADLQKYMAEKIPYIAFHKTVSEEKMKALREEALQELIDKELQYQAAEKKGIKPDEGTVEHKLAGMRAQFKSDKEFHEALAKAGLTEQGIKQQLSRDNIVQQFLDAEVVKKAAISDADLAAYYEANREKYLAPERWKLREMFFKVPADATKEERAKKKEKAEEVLARAKKGEDFGLLAWEFSEDDYKYKSGDVGYLHRDMLLPEIEKALVNVDPGEMTGVIETIYGYYIFYLETKLPTRQLAFEEVREKLKKEIQQKREKELKSRLLEDLRSGARISVP
ncbi:MAG: hypothetical protein FIA94_00020 [Nitrospirae bacterium]|nr:hypothetical protein [Nitrospirota bacterium]